MPVKATITPAIGRRAVKPLPQGGFEDAETIPNADAFAAPAFGRGTQDPTGNALQTRALAQAQASRLAESMKPRAVGAPNLLSTVLPDARWEGLKQALFESGVDRLNTGAKAHMGDAGFFDTQSPPMSRAFNTMTPRERLLLDEMMKQTPQLRRR